jgi:hypothetical protein
MAQRLYARSIVVGIALLFCYAIYGRLPSRAGAGAQIYSESGSEGGPPSRAGGKAAASDDATKTSVAQSYQVVDLGTFLSYSCFVIFLLCFDLVRLRKPCASAPLRETPSWGACWSAARCRASYSLAFQNHKI